ncbi:hypothetical protein [Thalassomonas actiniarum]|uniref:Uncharacterized protein n=1 Tax=Thalassomonas actiniarum TaxID=485447 RepID=A0AAF0C4B8_9GAMM|nr:hypothetical protein [Thalassomonas actiniarum]WDD99835.1 hypothetical protein SG35_003955 [Thalassomonas actiniarum]
MEPISQEEKRDYQEILSQIFGSLAKKWNINIRVLKLLEELLQHSKSCSQYMDKIPRPYYFGNTIKWASKQARQAVARHLKRGDEHYLLCLRGAGLKMRTKFQMAAMGI